MSRGLKIQLGKWKGKTVPVPPEEKGHSHFTSAILKKSLFSQILGLELDGVLARESSLFVDLFAGSGQMGLESLSMGFRKAAFYEISQERFRHLLSLKNLYSERGILFRKDSFRYFYESGWEEEFETLVYFLDPPYSFWYPDPNKIFSLIQEIRTLPHRNLILFVQAPANLLFPENWTKDFPPREFGSNKLYRISLPPDSPA
jgi:16S rRNA G966 N2-methylase RsmD